MQTFDLTSVGLSNVCIQIDGSCEFLKELPGEPVVFLIDEFHSDPCVAANIKIAAEIASKVDIGIIGVESHRAGVRANADNPLNNCPGFAVAFCETHDVYGVESKCMFKDQETDELNGEWPKADQHPFNYVRSMHFLARLSRIYRTNGIKTHLILNVGRKHIDHIKELISNNTVEKVAGFRASYVRVRWADYPATE